jgi:hypothetical protein
MRDARVIDEIVHRRCIPLRGGLDVPNSLPAAAESKTFGTGRKAFPGSPAMVVSASRESHLVPGSAHSGSGRGHNGRPCFTRLGRADEHPNDMLRAVKDNMAFPKKEVSVSLRSDS